MKYSYIFYVVAMFAITVNAQMFTKITEGEEVNDGGDSRAVNWIDYDNDGDLDLYVTNGPQAGQNNFLYRNNGDETFIKILSDPIAIDGKASDGTTWGDYDNDGDLDLFVVNWWGHNNLLYSNNGDGTFTYESSLLPSIGVTYSETASWGDYNKDGYLDLYVCNSGGSRNNQLFLNNTDGTFTRITSGPVVADQNYSRNVDWIDYNNDGHLDLFVTNEENQNNSLYMGSSNGLFSRVTGLSIVSDGGKSTSSNWEDIDNDGDFDLFVANWGSQNNFMYLNNNDGTFTKVTGQNIVTDAGNSFSSSFGDVDNDGDLDFVVTNAFVNSQQTNFMYINNGDGTFERDTSVAATETGWSYGCALGDYNNDGYLDLFVAKCLGANENNSLFKNNGGANHWLKMDLVGKVSNRSAIGTIVKLKAEVFGKSFWQVRRVAGQNGYCGQNLQIHFGLGDASVADSIVIEWASGIKQVLTNQNVNQRLLIVEDTTLTTVKDGSGLLDHFELLQNYPNPFNPTTKIRYTISTSPQSPPYQGGEAKQGWLVKIKVYDVLGNEVATLVNNEQPAGNYEVKFDGGNLPSGIYFYALRSEDFWECKKMILLK